MTKNSFQELKASFKKEGFKIAEFDFIDHGKYSSEDADWNYKDVTHTKKIHAMFDQIQGIISDEIQTSINLQKIPFFGITLPLVVVNYEYKKNDQIYFTSSGPFIILGNVINTPISKNETKVTTSFMVGSKGIFSLFNPFVKYFIKKNHAKVMMEDLPMRHRRSELRENGHSFYSPTETYSFSFSEEINRSNLHINSNQEIKINISKQKILTAKQNLVLGEEIGILSFFVTKKDNEIKLWPTTCPHEGAPLSSKCIENDIISCPWHSRRLKPLIIINKDLKTEIVPSIDFAVKENFDFFEIKFRNKPEYYNNKPYKHLSFNE